MTNIMQKPTAVGKEKEASGLSSGERNNSSPRQGQLKSGFGSEMLRNSHGRTWMDRVSPLPLTSDTLLA